MQFIVNIDGIRVPIQIVKRGKTTYWRISQWFLNTPTEKQKEVQNTLAMAASNNFGKPPDKIAEAVAKAFSEWEGNVKPENETAIEQSLKEIFGEHEVNAVKTYYEHLDRETALNRYRRRKLREENRAAILSPNVPRVPIPLKKEKSVHEITQNE